MKQLLLLLPFLIMNICVKAQSYQIVYQRYMQPPPPPSNAIIKKEAQGKIKAGYYHLLVKDSLSVSFRSMKKELSLNSYEDNFKGLVYYENTQAKKITITDYKILTDSYTQYLLSVEDWEIHSEYIPYKNYKAYLATNGDEKIYFVPELPILQGPQLHGGFPGLIVKIESLNSTLELVDIQPIEYLDIKMPNLEQLKYIHGNEFRKKRKDAYLGVLKNK